MSLYVVLWCLVLSRSYCLCSRIGCCHHTVCPSMTNCIVARWTHLTATGCHLPHGIARCYLLPVTCEHTPSYPRQTGWYSVYLPWRDGRLSWLKSVTYWDGLPAHRRSPIQVVNWQSRAGSRTRNLLFMSPMPWPLHHQATLSYDRLLLSISWVSC